jgi:flagellar biosynthesis protein FlhA
MREEATFRGYTIVDPATVLTTHLTEILKENMADLLSYAEVQKLLKDLPEGQKKLVDDLIPSVVSATTIQRVLQALLKERVSIRDLPQILEGIGEAAPHTSLGHPAGRAGPRPPRPPAVLGQSRRRRRPADHHPVGRLGAGLRRGPGRPGRGQAAGPGALAPAGLHPRRARGLRARRHGRRQRRAADQPGVRPYVRSIIERFRGQTVVMSQNEIHPRARLRTVGMV